MKKLALIFLLAFTTILNAGTITWEVRGVDDSFNSGTAYLLDISDYSGTINDIANTIIASGKLEKPLNTTIKDVSTGSIYTGAPGYTGTKQAVTESGIDFEAGDAFCVIIVDANNSTFFITESMDADPDKMLNSWGAQWGAWGTQMTGGTGIQTVPEPTVLALLALGVAGVALRRKKVVA